MKLNFEEIKSFFEDENNESYAFDLNTGQHIDPRKLAPNTAFGYINSDAIRTCAAVIIDGEAIDIPDANPRFLLKVEKYITDEVKEWEEVPNPEYEDIEELIEHGHISEGDVIRLTDLMGSHVVIDVEHGLTEPTGIYIVGYGPEDFMDAYAAEVMHAVYEEEEDDDDEDEDPFDGYELKLLPVSSMIQYIRRYSSLAKAAELVNID